jgi:CubicO group peptidase (beta-lactamase class C family)
MDSICLEQLEAEAPFFEELRRLSGAPALSLGVFHHGRIIYTKHLGRRDTAYSDPPNDDTVYYLASISKIISICAVACLVSEGVLEWDIPIRKYLPEFDRPDDDIEKQATLRDLACHRTGLPLAAFWWGQMEGEALLDAAGLVRQACHLNPVKPFRSSFFYSPWNYCLIHAVVEKVTGKPYGKVVDEIILAPLGLENTTFDSPPAKSKIALPYAVRNGGSTSRISVGSMDSSTCLSAGTGGKGTMKDILNFFNALVSSYNHQKENNLDSTPGMPFTQLRNILAPQISLSPESSSTYCLGTYRTKLPGVLSCASLNAPFSGRNSRYSVATTLAPKSSTTLVTYPDTSAATS